MEPPELRLRSQKSPARHRSPGRWPTPPIEVRPDRVGGDQDERKRHQLSVGRDTEERWAASASRTSTREMRGCSRRTVSALVLTSRAAIFGVMGALVQAHPSARERCVMAPGSAVIGFSVDGASGPADSCGSNQSETRSMCLRCPCGCFARDSSAGRPPTPLTGPDSIVSFCRAPEV